MVPSGRALGVGRWVLGRIGISPYPRSNTRQECRRSGLSPTPNAQYPTPNSKLVRLDLQANLAQDVGDTLAVLFTAGVGDSAPMRVRLEHDVDTPLDVVAGRLLQLHRDLLHIVTVVVVENDDIGAGVVGIGIFIQAG